MTKDHSKPLRVGLISLGCAKNLVDAEIMLGSLLKSSVEITNDAAQADAVIVNTCSFIDSAQEESVDAILESVELRDANRRGPNRRGANRRGANLRGSNRRESARHEPARREPARLELTRSCAQRIASRVGV